MVHENRHLVDIGVWFSAGVAAVSLANAAFMVTILVGLVSLALGLIRLHDRIKYGPNGGVE